MTTLILVLADDLTGALEAGALFSARGLPARVFIGTRPEPAFLDSTTPVLVIDTETRHSSRDAAFGVVRSLACAARERGILHLYKKTDSTLRGNVASELAAVAAACPDCALMYLPAYPQLGREVRGGHLLVDGVPVASGSFSADNLNPVQESHIPTLLSSEFSRAQIHSISPRAIHLSIPGSIYVVDGSTEEDLKSAAGILAASRQPCLAAGPAGFLRYLAEIIDWPRSHSPSKPQPASCLVVNGSRHEVSALQIRHAFAQGWPWIAAGAVTSLPHRPDWFMLRNPVAQESAAPEYASHLGQLACDVLRQVPLDGIVVFGGDTAHGVLNAMGVSSVWPLGELFPGVPVSIIKAADLPAVCRTKGSDLCFITKAGGFGTPDILSRIREQLSES